MADDYFQEYGPVERRRRTHDVQTVPHPAYELPHDEEPQRRRSPRPVRRSRRRLRMFLLGSGVMLFLLMVLAGAGLWHLDRTFEGRIYPNVAIQGFDLSQMTPTEAHAVLDQAYGNFLRHPVTITYNGRTWEPTAAEIGVSLNITQTVDAAYNLGRGANIVRSTRSVAEIWRHGYDLPLTLQIDQTKLKAYLAQKTQQFNVAPVNAGLVIGSNSAVVTPSRTGRIVLIDETALDIVSRLPAMEPYMVVLRTDTIIPLIQDEGVADAKRKIDAILQGPLTLTGGPELEWGLSVDDLRAMIVLEQVSTESGYTLQADLNENLLRQRVATYADQIGRGSVNPRVHYNEGNLTIIRQGQTALRLDEEASASRIHEQATIGNERIVELVVNEIDPDVTAENLYDLGLNEIVGVGRSSFIGSAPYRIQNIKAGSALLDGILIGPGEEFSFNEAIGSIDEANGFVKGYAIINNRTQEEWGGGICQDSTTLFRAAFHAGLPVTERHEHSFRITWYETYEPFGMDAAIFTGYLDLRFVNDTGQWLLLNTYVNEATSTVTYILYGTKPNREVLLDGPYVTHEYAKPAEPTYVEDINVPVGVFEQTDVARNGMDITVYRIIRQNGQVILREPFYTHFKPWPDIYLHNPATPRPPAGCVPNQYCPALEPPPPPAQPESPPESQPQPQPEPPTEPQPPAGDQGQPLQPAPDQ